MGLQNIFKKHLHFRNCPSLEIKANANGIAFCAKTHTHPCFKSLGLRYRDLAIWVTLRDARGLKSFPATPMRKKRFDNKGKNRRKATREDDATYRLTHLWAASHLLAESSATLSRFYVASSRQICRRINLKMDSVTIKRSFCKKCNALIIPGMGNPPTSVRQVIRREKCTIVTCGNCRNKKRYLSRIPGRGSDCAQHNKPARATERQLAPTLQATSSHGSSARPCILQ